MKENLENDSPAGNSHWRTAAYAFIPEQVAENIPLKQIGNGCAHR